MGGPGGDCRPGAGAQRISITGWRRRFVAGAGLRGFSSAGSLSSSLIAANVNALSFATSVRQAAVVARAIAAWAAPAGGAPPSIIVRALAADLDVPPVVPRALLRVAHVN